MSRDGYREKASGVAAVMSGGGEWSAPSPCAGWTAADVVGHMVNTQREFLAPHGVDLGARPDGEPPAVWDAHVAAVLDRVDDDVLHREYDGYFGRTTIGATLADVYGFDMVVHRWDLACALGARTTFTDAEMDGMEASIAVFGDHLYGEGICRPAVPVPADAPPAGPAARPPGPRSATLSGIPDGSARSRLAHTRVSGTMGHMALPAKDVALVRAWGVARVPERARDQVRIDIEVDERRLTVVERRAPLPIAGGPVWTREPVAQLRHAGFLWTLYWCNRDQRFRRYPELDPSTDVGRLLEEIDRDPHCLFWG